MRPFPALRLGFVLAVVSVGSACTEDHQVSQPSDPSMLLPGQQGDASVAPVADAGGPTTAPVTQPPLAACVDRPGDLPRPPSKELPCELLPPGFSR